jgi:hypothetical protein
MSLWPPGREDQAKLDRSLAGACPLGSVYAARRSVAPRGASKFVPENRDLPTKADATASAS